MAGDAARLGDKHVCPKATDKPHVGGPITEGEASVLICGQPAARVYDSASCQGDDLFSDYILLGRDDVLIGAQPAARRYDPTLHGGMVMAGCYSVEIGGAHFDAIAAAINRIKATPFGRTEEGRRLVKRLTELHAQGKIEIAGPSGDGSWGESDPRTDKIEVNAHDPEDVDHIASVLVHEGTHIENNERQRNGEFMDPLDEERSAWDAQSRFRKDMSQQGSRPENELERTLSEYDQARDKEKFLKDTYRDEHGSDSYWEELEEYWKQEHDKRGHER